MSGPQIRAVSATPDVEAAGNLLLEALLASLKRAPRCACGRTAIRAETKLEIIGCVVAVDLHLRCAVCA